MEEFEYGLIEEALRYTQGNKAAAAQMLGLKRTTLVAKLRCKKRSASFLSPACQAERPVLSKAVGRQTTT